MTSNRPYLIRAFFEWISDNGLTPHLLVNADMEGVQVPRQYVHEGRIVLNIGVAAVHHLSLGNEVIEFSARFGGNPFAVCIPTVAVIALYAREDSRCSIVFGEEPEPPSPPPRDDAPSDSSEKPAEKRPSLKVVK